jgi:hypothetical protein
MKKLLNIYSNDIHLDSAFSIPIIHVLGLNTSFDDVDTKLHTITINTTNDNITSHENDK